MSLSLRSFGTWDAEGVVLSADVLLSGFVSASKPVVPRADGVRVLALDVGSSSVRASLYDHTGKRIEGSHTQLPYLPRITPDGGAVMVADDLLDLVARAVDGTLAGGRAGEISGVATSTFWHSVLGLNREGRPTTPVLTWADRRAAGAAAYLRRKLDEAAVHGRTGCMLHSSYLPAKLLWLSHTAPEDFERTERWISFGEYLNYRLFGETRVGTSMASATGLFSQNQKKWDSEVLAALPVDKTQLSPISDEPLRGVVGRVGQTLAPTKKRIVVPSRR